MFFLTSKVFDKNKIHSLNKNITCGILYIDT